MSSETFEHELNQLVDKPITILVPWCNKSQFAFFGSLESFIDEDRVRFHFVGDMVAFAFGIEDVERVDHPMDDDIVSHVILIKKLN